ncbi:MAG: VOC family protein [Actinomycetota bacterium]
MDVMLLATDLGVARRFYKGTLGLPLLVADEQFLTFGCGGDSRLVVTKSTTGTAEEATKASWRVDNLPELGTVDGVADLGFALAAWFIDPDHNGIGPLQLKDPDIRPADRPTSTVQGIVVTKGRTA